MKILLMGNQAESLYRFRKDLIAELRQRVHEIVLVTPETTSEMRRLIESAGASLVTVPFHRTSLNPFSNLKTFFMIWKVLNAVKPNVVFCFTIKPVIYGSLAARFCGIRECYSMITGTGSIFSENSLKHRLARWVVKRIYRLSLGFNRTVFFQNPQDLDMFTKEMKLLDGEKAVLIAGSGVNLTEYLFVPVPEGPVRFLYMGRLLREKGIGEFAEAAIFLKIKYPQVQFDILGPFDSNPTAISPKEMDGWKQSAAVNYLGETFDVKPFLSASTVFVLPSYYREGIPRSSLEALAMGRPIVTTDWTGCREVVIEGKNGFLVPVRDINALAQAMERFIQDPSLAPRMGKESRKLAEEKFDVRKVNRIILEKMGLFTLTDDELGSI